MGMRVSLLHTYSLGRATHKNNQPLPGSLTLPCLQHSQGHVLSCLGTWHRDLMSVPQGEVGRSRAGVFPCWGWSWCYLCFLAAAEFRKKKHRSILPSGGLLFKSRKKGDAGMWVPGQTNGLSKGRRHKLKCQVKCSAPRTQQRTF